MIDGKAFWNGYTLIVARGVFLGTLGAYAVVGLARLAADGIRALWRRYGHRIY